MTDFDVETLWTGDLLFFLIVELNIIETRFIEYLDKITSDIITIREQKCVERLCVFELLV